MKEYAVLLQRVDDIYERAKGVNDDALLAHLAKYCCLLGCASLELGVKDAVIGYVQRRASKQILKYVAHQLDYLSNPRPKVILDLLGGFDQTWSEKFETYIDSDGQRIRDSLGSLVGHRNLIAHGRNSDVSFGRLRPWLADAKRAIAHLEADILQV